MNLLTQLFGPKLNLIILDPNTGGLQETRPFVERKLITAEREF